VKCPYCGAEGFKSWKELQYENSSDPTPEYGGKLKETLMENCDECSCEAQ